jgi:FecR protein
MKYIQMLITMVIGASVVALSNAAVAQSVKPCMVTVVRIQGVARYSLGDNQWHPLVVGKVLRSGAIIQSAANSTVDLVLSGEPIAMPQAGPSPQTISPAPDPNVRGLVSARPMVQQNVIRMFGNTVLAIDKLTQFDTGVDTVSDTEVDLRTGGIFGSVKKMSASSQFIIKIPNGVAGIRGSRFVVTLKEVPSTVPNTGNMVWVLDQWLQFEGSSIVSIANPGSSGPSTQVVSQGQQLQNGQVGTLSSGLLSWGTALGSQCQSLFQFAGGPSSLNNNNIDDRFGTMNLNQLPPMSSP